MRYGGSEQRDGFTLFEKSNWVRTSYQSTHFLLGRSSDPYEKELRWWPIPHMGMDQVSYWARIVLDLYTSTMVVQWDFDGGFIPGWDYNGSFTSFYHIDFRGWLEEHPQEPRAPGSGISRRWARRFGTLVTNRSADQGPEGSATVVPCD